MDSDLVVSRIKQKAGPFLPALQERERRVVELRFGLADGRRHTLKDVGREFGLSPTRIRQIEMRALAKMRGQGLGV